jgi:hypothetical protein
VSERKVCKHLLSLHLCLDDCGYLQFGSSKTISQGDNSNSTDQAKGGSARVFSFEADNPGNGHQNPQQCNAVQHSRIKKSQVSPIPFKAAIEIP